MFTNRYKNKKFNKNAPPPRPIIKYNPPPKKQSILSNIGQSFTGGVGMGAGSEMGHSVFRNIFGSNQNTQNNDPLTEKLLSSDERCNNLTLSFEKCLNSHEINNEKCEILLEQMKKACANY